MIPGRVWMLLGIVVVIGAWKVFFTAPSSTDNAVAACRGKPRSVTAGTQGGALLATQEFIACVRRESGGKVSKDFTQLADLIEVPPLVDCKFVGRWKSLRPDTTYLVTLEADRRFEAHSIGGKDHGEFAGSWVTQGNRIHWVYDAKVVWPPDANEIKDHAGDTFSVVEVNREVTRFERMEKLPCP